jgi:ankyrin repeat protein
MEECLFELVSMNSIDRVSKILDSGYDINTRLSSGDCVMHVAALFSSIDTVLFLIQNGAEINVSNSGEQTPFDLSINNPNREVRDFFDCIKKFYDNISVFRYYTQTMEKVIDAFFTVCLETESVLLLDYFDICMKLIKNN